MAIGGPVQRVGANAIPGTFHFINKVYLSPFKVILDVGNAAFQSFGGLFISILIIGGMMGVVNSTGAIDLALKKINESSRYNYVR